jgi:hypothetical protein
VLAIVTIADGSRGHRAWVMLNRDKSVAGWASEQEAHAYFTRGYNASHRRSYEASMSACIHAIEFDPRVHVFADEAAFKARLAEIAPFPYPVESVSSISGHYLGIRLQPEAGIAFHQQGRTPDLIS